MQTINWWNAYIGIPYVLKGRNRNGVDCWGLARLVYEEQYSITLPSFDDTYDTSSDENIQEIVARQKEGWEEVKEPAVGDVVLFKVLGRVQHIGVYIGNKMFLHAREGYSSCIERLDSGSWKHRLAGAWRYKPNAVVKARTNPLKSTVVDFAIPEGLTVKQFVEFIKTKSDDFTEDCYIFVDGKVINKESWDEVKVHKDQVIEYRAIIAGGSGFGRTLAFAAVAVGVLVFQQAYLLPLLGGTGATVAGLTASQLAIYAGTGIALNIAGAMLVNSIFPVRQPKQQEQARSQLLLQGGQNTANRYGAIPVVLGKFRYTPYLGANTFVESYSKDSYLKGVVCWGYGPLIVSDIRIGDVPITNYEKVKYETIGDYDYENESAETKDFYKIYPAQDVSQENIGVELLCPEFEVESLVRASNVLTVTTKTSHEFSTEHFVNVRYNSLSTGWDQVLEIIDSKTFKISDIGTDETISIIGKATTLGSTWTTRIISQPSDKIKFTFHFPEGLRHIVTEGGNAGKVGGSPANVWIQYRQLDPDTLVPLTSWGNIRESCSGGYFKIGNAFFNTDADSEMEKVYRWTRFTFDEDSVIRRYDGCFTDSQYSEPSAGLLKRLQDDTFGLDTVFKSLPDIGEGEEELYQVCTYGNQIIEVIDKRSGAGADVIGCDYIVWPSPSQRSSPAFTISSGSIVRAVSEAFSVGAEGQPFYKRKDAFTFNKEYEVTNAIYEVRARRTDSSNKSYTTPAGNLVNVYHSTIWQSLTGYATGKPIIAPKGTQLAMTAYSIKANNQLNGSIEGITGTVQSVCWDYVRDVSTLSRTSNVVTCNTSSAHGLQIDDRIQIEGCSVSSFNGTFTVKSTPSTTSFTFDDAGSNETASSGRIWEYRSTRNPASLFRYVLQHPANAQRVPDSQIDLDAISDWHTYCRTNKFFFDAVITDTSSLLDVLRDIAAAGRSSPSFVDGRWSVITDKPRSFISQHFTPHNSWGFEGVRVLPKIPHAFRVSFNNAEKSYQPDEMIVYNDGYSSANATLFEGLTLPGVTTTAAVYKHARFHLAQIKLRPETYTLNADIEHLICNRGDLVKVTHDVPMWGIASARIKNRISSTVFELDEEIPMDASTSYTIRVRSNLSGASTVRTVQAVGTDGYYRQITITSSATTSQIDAGDLVLFGELNSESVDLIVQSIEPSENLTARITLVDYSPAVYNSDSEEIPAFDSQITQPPVLLQKLITQKPTITKIVSDESVIERVSPGVYKYFIKVSYTNPRGLSDEIDAIEGQIDSAEDTAQEWSSSTLFKLTDKTVMFDDVQEGDAYRIRLRYVDRAGKVGPWTAVVTHTVVGKTNPPAAVTGLVARPEGTKIRLDWNDNLEPDISLYEVREANSGWGDGNRLFKGKSSTCLVNAPALGQSKTWYVKAIDGTNLYSKTASSVSYSNSVVANTTNAVVTFQDTSLTNATVTIDWVDVNPTFGLAGYKVEYNSTSKFVKASTITLPANWIGDRTFTIKTVDNSGSESTGYVKVVTKQVPNPASNLRAQVIDNNVLLYWTMPAKTTLPVQDVIVKKGASYDTAEVIGTKNGAFTSLQERQSGTYTYWVTVRDTDNQESEPVSVTAKVNEPPDFIFYGQLQSTFTGTKSNAVVENGSLLIPVNTTETFEQHFTSRSWSTPQDQITAGYPLYVQPVPTSGYYQEVFDFGTIISTSNITVNFSKVAVAGAVSIVTKIEVSDDNTNWVLVTDNDTAGIANTFRYIRIRLSASGTDVSVCRISNLSVKLDAKLKSDSGNVSALSTDTAGTVANFTKEFLDVTSITVSPNSTTPVTAVYDFQDSVLSGTYSVTSNVCTVNVTGHGLVAGQNVRLTFSTGTAPNGVYTVSTASTNSFTVPITTANTSGNASTYPQGIRIYLFNSSGTRVSATCSWAVRGY